ncbi:MAG: tetratricopeptide repeat protein [Deltaproteobacteria bacterium]|nr:tetratricopeptide repeat protein [Deltaproteobacteria bacterium]
MATSKVTRKEIRQPDWFQVNSDRAIDFVQNHVPQVVSAAAVVLLVLIGVWAWQSFKERQNIAAGQEFSKAVELFQTQKYSEAIAGFEKVQGYRWSRYAGLSHLYQTNIYLATSDLDKALNSGQRAVIATSPSSLYRQLALVALASAEERKNQCKLAIDHFIEAQKIVGPLQNDATLGKARCAEQLGDRPTVIAAYKEFLKDNPGSSLGLKLAELEASTAVAPAKVK